jgi:hypothetical protein
MSRRFQFSLRALLVATLVICLSLGVWHLLETYGTSVAVENARVGAPIVVKARYFWPRGPDECTLFVGYARNDDTGCVEKYLRAKRSWLGFYTVDYELDRVDRPCQINAYFGRYEKSTGWTLKETLVDVN